MFSIIQAVTEPAGWAQYGILGLVITALLGACTKLYADNQKLHEKLDGLFRENATRLEGLTTAIRELSAAQCNALQRLTDQLDIARRLESLERGGLER